MRIKNVKHLIFYEDTIAKKGKLDLMKHAMVGNSGVNFINNKFDPLFIVILDIFRNNKYNKYFVDFITKRVIKYHIKYYDPYFSCDQWKQYIISVLRELICNQGILHIPEFKKFYDLMNVLEEQYISQDNSYRINLYNKIVEGRTNNNILLYEHSNNLSNIVSVYNSYINVDHAPKGLSLKVVP
jgi:hypothetical protein